MPPPKIHIQEPRSLKGVGCFLAPVVDIYRGLAAKEGAVLRRVTLKLDRHADVSELVVPGAFDNRRGHLTLYVSPTAKRHAQALPLLCGDEGLPFLEPHQINMRAYLASIQARESAAGRPLTREQLQPVVALMADLLANSHPVGRAEQERWLDTYTGSPTLPTIGRGLTSAADLPNGEAAIDLSSSHSRIMAQLGLLRKDHFYRSVGGRRGLQAIESIFQTGFIRNRRGSGEVFFGSDGFKKYTLKPREQRPSGEKIAHPGYIIELAPETLQLFHDRPTNANGGGDAARIANGDYRQSKQAVPLARVTRIIRIDEAAHVERHSFKNSPVHWSTIYDRNQPLQLPLVDGHPILTAAPQDSLPRSTGVAQRALKAVAEQGGGSGVPPGT